MSPSLGGDFQLFKQFSMDTFSDTDTQITQCTMFLSGLNFSVSLVENTAQFASDCGTHS